jgi:hypothetical protein
MVGMHSVSLLFEYMLLPRNKLILEAQLPLATTLNLKLFLGNPQEKPDSYSKKCMFPKN